MTRCCLMSLLMLSLLPGCSAHRVSSASLDSLSRPAFISRIEETAGPRSRVFREDDSFRPKLKKLEPQEADRRLHAKLVAAMTRFEISERLRVQTQSRLPQAMPWTRSVEPVRVASVLESFLVEEVPANAPDYDLLLPLGVDSVVEFVIQEYGMRSERGRTGVYMAGYGRLFRLNPRREELWRRPFRLDRVAEEAPHLDPFKVGKTPALYHQEMMALLDEVAEQLADGLNPPQHEPRPVLEERRAPQRPAAPPPTPARDELPPGELPDPDSRS